MKNYKVVRVVRTGANKVINESEPMRYAQGMQVKEQMMARDRYYDEGASFLNAKKWVYWLRDKANNRGIKVRLVVV